MSAVCAFVKKHLKYLGHAFCVGKYAGIAGYSSEKSSGFVMHIDVNQSIPECGIDFRRKDLFHRILVCRVEHYGVGSERPIESLLEEFFSTMYSVNMIEYLPGRFINYIALGNQFSFGDCRLQLDFMNRATDMKDIIGKDMSIMTEFQWKACDRLNVIAKFTYDINRTGSIGDLCVAPGTDIYRAGATLEYFPIKTYKDLRMHLSCCHTNGKSPESAVLRPKQTIVDAGITWKVGLLNIKNRKN